MRIVKDRENTGNTQNQTNILMCMKACMHTYIYICTYIYIYRERERETANVLFLYQTSLRCSYLENRDSTTGKLYKLYANHKWWQDNI